MMRNARDLPRVADGVAPRSLMSKPWSSAMSTLFESFTDDPDFDAAPEASSPQPVLRGQLTSALDARRYISGGKGVITLVSTRSGQRFTYRLTAKENEYGNKTVFVGLLSGPDNTRDYAYLGRIATDRHGSEVFWQGRRTPRAGDVSPEAPSSKAFAWVWRNLVRGTLPAQLEVWHEGRCGRCGRKLTVPTSVAQGFGPECINHV